MSKKLLILLLLLVGCTAPPAKDEEEACLDCITIHKPVLYEALRRAHEAGLKECRNYTWWEFHGD